MTTVEDTLTDEEREEVEGAKLEAKREKTKYGSLISDGLTSSESADSSGDEPDGEDDE